MDLLHVALVHSQWTEVALDVKWSGFSVRSDRLFALLDPPLWDQDLSIAQRLGHFLHYASKITSLVISIPASDLLIDQIQQHILPTNTILSPRLRLIELDASPTLSNMQSTFLLFAKGAGILSMNIMTEEDNTNPSQFLHTAGHEIPHLKELFFCTTRPRTEYTNFRELRVLHHSGTLTVADWDVLARGCPSLEKVAIRDGDAPASEVVPALVDGDMVALLSLHELILDDSFGAWFVEPILKRSKMPQLLRLRASLRSARGVNGEAIHALAAGAPLLQDLVLLITEPLNFHTLRHLSRIQKLCIRDDADVLSVTDDDLQLLASGMPNLQVLKIRNAAARGPVRVGIASLHHLASHCQALVYLEIPLNPSDHNLPTDVVAFPNLRSLVLSPLYLDSGLHSNFSLFLSGLCPKVVGFDVQVLPTTVLDGVWLLATHNLQMWMQCQEELKEMFFQAQRARDPTWIAVDTSGYGQFMDCDNFRF